MKDNSHLRSTIFANEFSFFYAHNYRLKLEYKLILEIESDLTNRNSIDTVLLFYGFARRQAKCLLQWNFLFRF